MERYLEGNPVGAIVGEEAKQYGWQQLHHRYAQRLQSMKGRFTGKDENLDPIG
jgi:hypothetical protein